MWMAFGLTGSFMVAEVIGGLITGSLALISDAAHMLTDTAALGIALFATRMARRPRDVRRTYGYGRVEILAAAFNASMLFAVAIYIFVEAVDRLREPTEVESLAMLGIAATGLVVNLISMRLLAGGEKTNLNVKGAYLEVWSDMLGSIGVIVGALTIRFTGWAWVDPVIATAIALWVLPRTWILLRDSVNVLLEGIPGQLNLAEIERRLREDVEVQDVHDLHVWSLGSGQNSLTAHVVVKQGTVTDAFIDDVRAQLKKDFGITQVTLQCEFSPCIDGLECSTDNMLGNSSDEASLRP